MIPRIWSLPALIGLLGLIAGCTEPGASACANANRAVTLGNLAGNSMSGSYTQCVADLGAELQGLRLQSRSLQAEAARLNVHAATLDGERRASAQRLAALNTEQAAIMQRLSTARSGAQDARMREVLGTEQQLRQDIAAQGQGIDAAASRRLAERQVALNRLAQQAL